MTLLVDGQAAVGVAVERDAKIVPAGIDRVAERFQMRRAAAVIDVDAVRLVVQILRLQREAAEQIPRRGRGRAVGAVDEHAQRLKPVDSRGQMVEIIFRRKTAGHDLPDPAVRLDGQLAVLQNQRLNARLERVA